MARTMARRRGKAETAVPLTPRVKVWLETERAYALGFGLCEILRAVARAGSIKGAAAELGKSYRHVWGRVKAAEEALGVRLVETQQGGQGTQRSELTGEAVRLVEQFLALRQRMAQLLEREFARRFGAGKAARLSGTEPRE